MSVKRKLAAIMFTDIAGFTELSAKDEEGAFSLLEKQREILRPFVKEFDGEWLKEMGDGLLLSFPSSKQAVNCAIKIQLVTGDIDDLNLRIGIHQGDILVKGNDIFGDDVNVASRIEPFAAVGGVAISHKIQSDISSSPEFETKFISKPSLKGVRQEVKVYCITSHGLPETETTKVTAKLENDISDDKIQKLSKAITVKSFIIFTTSTLLFIFSINTLLNTTYTNLINFDKIHKTPIRLAVLDFKSTLNDVPTVIIQGAKRELYQKLQSSRFINLVGDFDLEKINMKQLCRKEISDKLNVNYIITGSLIKDNGHYIVNSELYNREKDETVSLYSPRIPIQTYQETSLNIADSLSCHFSNIFNITIKGQKNYGDKEKTTRDSYGYIFGILQNKFGKNKMENDNPSYSDEVYQAIITSKQFLEKNTIDDNFEAIILIETALVSDSANSDLMICKSEAYYQRGRLLNKTAFLLKAEELIITALKSKNISSEAKATGYYIMSKLSFDRDNLLLSKSYVQYAIRLNSSNPNFKKQFRKVTQQYLANLGG